MFKSCVRSGLCNGAECWVLKKKDTRKLQTTEMRMLRMIRGKTLRDGISNKRIREMAGVEKIEEFLRVQRLRWLGHIERMDHERATEKAKSFNSRWFKVR